MASVVVIGGGVGGLAAAVRLAVSGHTVTVLERRDELGGKLARLEVDGFTFDTGPSLLTLPHVFEQLFSIAGDNLHHHLELRRLEVACRYHFDDGSNVDFCDSAEQTAANLGPSGTEYLQFLQRAQSVWNVAERTFFTGPMGSPLSLMKRMQSPADFVAIDPLRNLDAVGRCFDDRRLRTWLNRYATYSGSSPYRAPATLACISWIEQHYGAWHVIGGLAKLADALAGLARRVGVELHTGVDVSEVIESNGRVSGVVANRQAVAADVVVANCDAEHLYRDLLPRQRQLRRTARAGRSTSGFALLVGVDGESEGLSHHNIWFTGDQRREFAQINGRGGRFGDGVADDPTVYVCCSSKTDATQAPDGAENWFILVNVAAGASGDWTGYQSYLMERLGIVDRARFTRAITPQDLATEYRAPGGAIYGSSSNGTRSAFLRAGNRGPIPGLYLAGGSAHPGGGLPLVAMSGAIVAGLVDKDFR